MTKTAPGDHGLKAWDLCKLPDLWFDCLLDVWRMMRKTAKVPKGKRSLPAEGK